MRRRLQLAEEDDDDSTMVHKTPRRWNEEWRFGWLGVLQDTIPYRIGRGVKVVVRLSSPGQRTPTTVGLVTTLDGVAWHHRRPDHGCLVAIVITAVYPRE